MLKNHWVRVGFYLLSFGAAMLVGPAQAAQKDSGSNAKIVAKLQAMVKDITAERDLLKTENGKVAAELETLKSQVDQDKKDLESATQAQDKLNADLAAQKSASDEVRARLDDTIAKLRDAYEKYKVLEKAKNELAVAYAKLQNTEQQTSSELNACESKNLKMYEGAKEVMEGLQGCQKRGIVDTLISTEPFTQIDNVEFETIMQGYEDKLNKQKYSKKEPIKVATSPDSKQTQAAPSVDNSSSTQSVSPSTATVGDKPISESSVPANSQSVSPANKTTKSSNDVVPNKH